MGLLNGQRILLLRDDDPRNGWWRTLMGTGAFVRVVPLTMTMPPAEPEPMLAAGANLPGFDWVALTSPRAVRALAAAATEKPRPHRPRFACVGPGTAGAFHRWTGRDSELVPERTGAEALARELLDRVRGRRTRVLFPAADNARPELPALLRAAGVEVEQVTAYRTMECPVPFARLEPGGRGAWSAVVVTSGTIARVLVGILEPALGPEWKGWAERNGLTAVGARSREALRGAGVEAARFVPRPDVRDLIGALALNNAPAARGAEDVPGNGEK